MERTSCDKAAPGWRCTRDAGHDGPCAAVRVARLSSWLYGAFGGVYYERASGWNCGANYHLLCWAIPLWVEFTRIYGSGPDGKKEFGFQRLNLTVRILFVSFGITVWNRA